MSTPTLHSLRNLENSAISSSGSLALFSCYAEVMLENPPKPLTDHDVPNVFGTADRPCQIGRPETNRAIGQTPRACRNALVPFLWSGFTRNMFFAIATFNDIWSLGIYCVLCVYWNLIAIVSEVINCCYFVHPCPCNAKKNVSARCIIQCAELWSIYGMCIWQEKTRGHINLHFCSDYIRVLTPVSRATGTWEGSKESPFPTKHSGNPATLSSKFKTKVTKSPMCFNWIRVKHGYLGIQFIQWPFQEPKLEVPTIYIQGLYKAYVREYPSKIWP